MPSLLQACLLLSNGDFARCIIAFWLCLGTSACGQDWADWRNTSGQQPSPSLAFCRHVFYVIPDRMVRCARGNSLSLRKFLRATTGRTLQNNSCQQAALSLAFCMHVLSVFTDTVVRRAIGVSLCLRKCLRPTVRIIAWGGLAALRATYQCLPFPFPQACTITVNSRHQSQTAAGGLYSVYACRGPAARPR